jgi:putative ABC transport system permease protein
VDRVFGLPAGPLAVTLAVLLVGSVAVVTVLAARNVVFLKMGLRNIPRRRGRSILIVAGLMLGTTIITSALITGDTMTTAVRSSVIDALGATDETVTAGTESDVEALAGVAAARSYFPADEAVAAVDAAAASLPVDGVTAAIIEPVAAQHAAGGRTEPRIVLMAPQEDRAAAFGLGDVTGLGAGEVLLDAEAAEELDAVAGSEITVLAGERLLQLRVAAVGTWRGTGTDGPSMVLALGAAQELLDRPGQANHVLVSNRGDDTSGVDLTGTVEPALDEAVAPLGLNAHPAKQDGLDAADATGNAFVQLFTTFGSFSIAAGILLIFLIFVMLATERRPEMGMARAVGTQRRHLVQTFLYEGAAYDLLAAAVGAVLGLGVAWVMVWAVARSFTDGELELEYSVSPQSLLIAYAIGVLLTLVVVTVSAWRVSRLNIVSAIRDLPEPAEPGRRGTRWVLIAVGAAVGLLLAVSGASSQVYMPWMLGISILVVTAAPVARALGASGRVAYTGAAFLLLGLWLLPFDTFDALLGEMSMDFSIWVVGGLVVVIAATWLVTYNADVLLGLVTRLASPFASLRPIAKMAVAYPLKSRFRTGVTLSMFMLVVFTLVTGSTIPTAFTNSFDDVEQFGGGFDVRVATAPALAVDDLTAELPADLAADVEATGAQSFLPLEARQRDTGGDFASYPLRGVDDGFAARTTYEMAAMAHGYATPREVWQAVGDEPGLAVVDAFVAPRRSNWGFGVPPEFQLSGFYLEDGAFDPVPVEVVDPLTGTTVELTVIGVLSDNAPLEMAGITVGQEVLTPFGERATPTVHHLEAGPGTDPDALAEDVEASLLALGAEAESYADILDDAVGASMLFIRLVQGFMALGLVVGVAALGVISARAVVERRQQLGMLRAIGFQPEMIRRTLLAETAIVAVSAIVTGTVLGLLISYSVIADTRSQLGYQDLEFAVPWLNLGLIFGAVLVASLLTTTASALRATRIYPAEALRYQ